MQNGSIKSKTAKDQKGLASSLNNRHSFKPKAFGCCSAGFTLIETLVSIFVFSILAIIFTGIFAQAVQIQAGSFNAQRTVENSLLILESIARDIRVSQICPAGSNCSLNRLDTAHPVRGSVS